MCILIKSKIIKITPSLGAITKPTNCTVYTVTLFITHKVLLQTSLQVPIGRLAEVQPPFSPGKYYIVK